MTDAKTKELIEVARTFTAKPYTMEEMAALPRITLPITVYPGDVGRGVFSLLKGGTGNRDVNAGHVRSLRKNLSMIGSSPIKVMTNLDMSKIADSKGETGDSPFLPLHQLKILAPDLINMLRKKGMALLDGQHRTLAVEGAADPVTFTGEVIIGDPDRVPGSYVNAINMGRNYSVPDALKVEIHRSPWIPFLDKAGINYTSGRSGRRISLTNLMRATVNWNKGQVLRNTSDGKEKLVKWFLEADTKTIKEVVSFLKWYVAIVEEQVRAAGMRQYYQPNALALFSVFYRENKDKPGFSRVKERFNQDHAALVNRVKNLHTKTGLYEYAQVLLEVMNKRVKKHYMTIEGQSDFTPSFIYSRTN